MSNVLSYNYIELEQPVGTIYMGKLNAEDIYSISKSYVRTENEIYGIQRRKNLDRIKDISTYCMDPDAIFPTPIILSGNSKYVSFDIEKQMIHINLDLINQDNYKFSIVDGQHRLEGIHLSGQEKRFVLPIMLTLDTTPEQDAYLFSVINGNQKSVSKSLVFDLFSLSKERTIQKVCNYLVKQLNSDLDSTQFRKIKMLGVRTEESPNALVSQATVVRNLMPYFTKNVEKDNLQLKLGNELESLNPKIYIFRDYYKNQKDEIIYKILLNYFNAIVKAEKECFDEKTINFLQKTIGYTTKIQLIRPLYLKGLSLKELTEGYFESELITIFQNYNKLFTNKKIYEDYGSSDNGARKLYLDFINAWLNHDVVNIDYISEADKKRIDLFES